MEYFISCMRNCVKRKINIVEIFTFYLWYAYYGLNSIHEKTNYIFINELLKKEEAFFWFPYGVWAINGYLFSKVFFLIFNDKKINKIMKMIIIISLLIISILFYYLFLGLFIGHKNNIYFITFDNYLYDDMIFLTISIALYLFFYGYKCLFINQKNS